MNKEDNTSGMGKSSVLPTELEGWNWGAFLLNLFWGIGNKTYISLLCFVPFLNMIMPFVLGIKGNEWAWQNRRWNDVEHFRRVQRSWTRIGLLIIFVVFPFFFILLFTSIMGSMKGEAYEMALSEISRNEDVIEHLGLPIEPGYFVTGSITTSGPKGEAHLSFTLEGTKEEATAAVYALKEMGTWSLEHVIVYNKERSWDFTVVSPKQK
ncbi:hypothetical protein IEN85_15805 [Pelagicoccus sp. NFK12]|uniref:Cytochrome oxidase complex assembly protein 1 n=1 Tax=Pelagicoccus enzymogenes TaxID=2773457 RepID=A0A927FC27_9BACT|nr:cytochrome c oxidase assembly factor Coa1 family protein [Pelagicoccus enzymogenes]MBD5780965.1 hypothetical protein [Pelagicoccus enzymogenes]